MQITSCRLCPRACGVDRTEKTGACGVRGLKIARAALHFWEEPPISGQKGSGTVFFSGCSLRCCFCQNEKISHQGFGREIPVARLAEIFLELQARGAHNLNLVTPTQFVPWIIEALELAGKNLQIPVVYNSSGYETVETLALLEGYVDVYLPDFKYFSPALSAAYSGAPDYFAAASRALLEMARQQPAPVLEGGLLRRGLLIRHLVLPGAYRDSLALLDWLARHVDPKAVLISLMCQYTPMRSDPPELNRRVTSFEYRKVVDRALELGFQGFTQSRSSARETYTPPFDLEGV